MDSRQPEIARLITEETGGTFGWGIFNCILGAGILREAAAQTYGLVGEIIPSDLPDTVAMATRQPVGVVVGIAPWNAPLILCLLYTSLADSPKISVDRPLRDELDLFLLLPRFSPFLSVIQQIAPAPLAQAAVQLAQKGPAGWQQAIEDFWHGDPELTAAADISGLAETGDSNKANFSDQLLAWIFLQPYAEYLADHREIAIVDGTPSTCPLCGGKPIVGVLRSEGCLLYTSRCV